MRGIIVHPGATARPAAPPPVPASPTAPIVSGYRSAKCAVPGTGASATPVVIAGCDGSTAQDWTIEADGTIQADGKCLDIYRQGEASKTPVDLYACTGGAKQQWKIPSAAP